MCLIWLEISSSSNIADFYNGRSITGGMNGKGKYTFELSQYWERSKEANIFSENVYSPGATTVLLKRSEAVVYILREPLWKTTKLTTFKLHSGRGLLTTQTTLRNVVVWVCVSFSFFRASQKKTLPFQNDPILLNSERLHQSSGERKS